MGKVKWFLLITAVNLDEQKANILNPYCVEMPKEQWGTDFWSFTIFLYICNRD